jgi:DNA modification methylase
MTINNNPVSISQGGKSTSDIQSLVGIKERNFKIKVTEPLSVETSTGLTQQYENCVSLTNTISKIRINDVVISDSTNALYNYSNRNSEIEVLMESIREIGQQQPIKVIQKDDKYIVIDGVLRFLAMIRLDLNAINALISDFDPTNEFSLSDLIIHNQIQKVKTEDEKLNEIKTILRIGSDDYNSTNDREKRIKLVSKLLGVSGFRRNNVYMLEKVLNFENKSDMGFDMGKRVIARELSPARAIEALDIIKSGKVAKEKEKESNVIKGFLKGDYEKDDALNLIGSYDLKKKVKLTEITPFPIRTDMYEILQGDVETIELPQDLEIDMMFTSPPYYQLVKYGKDPNELGWEKTPDLYITRLSNIIMKGYERLKDTGSIFINLGDTYQNCQNMAIPERLIMELISRGLNFVDRIVWDKDTSGKPIGNNIHRLMPSYELILHFSKTKNYYFEKIKLQSDKVLKVSRGCKEKHTDKVSYHIPNNYNQIRSVIDDNLVETIPGVMSLKNKITLAQNKSRTQHVEGEEHHPATFSHSLPIIPLLMSCPKSPETVVFDPFMGSGSCGVTALLMGMKFVGVELYDKNIQSASRLLSEIESQYDEKSLNQILGNNREDVTEEITDTEKVNQLKSNIRMKLDLQPKQAA